MSGTNAIYYLLLLSIVGFGLAFGRDGKRCARKAVFVVLTSAAMALIIGLRYGIGFDYFNYLELFQTIQGASWSGMWSLSMEPGFVLLSRLLMLISDNLTFLYLAYAFLMMGVLGYVVYRHSELPWLSFFVFVTLAYLGSSMNYLRQTFAAILFLLAIPFLQKRRIVPYMAIVLLAASFHKSALILLVVYFIAVLPLNRVTGSLYGAVTVLSLLFSHLVMRLVTQYIFTAYTDNSYFSQGSSLLYVFFPILFAAIALACARRLTRLDKTNIVYVNLMVYGLFFSLLMMRHFIVERFSMYFMLSAILVAPLIVKTFEPALAPPLADDGRFHSESAERLRIKNYAKERRQFYVAVIAGLCLMLFIHFGLGTSYKFHNVYPYYSIFSEEAREGKTISFIPYWQMATEKQREA